MSVAFKNISLSYKEKVILEDISFCISRGELLGIVGPNGSGKTTLMKLVAGDFMPSKGVIKYDDTDLKRVSLLERAKYRSVMSQSQNIIFDFTVREIIQMGVIGGYGLNNEKEVAKKIQHIIKLLDIEKLFFRSIQTLSGGEQQLVHFARALIQIWEMSHYETSKYIFLDEPTSNLDLKQEVKILDITKNEVKKGLGAMVIFHDLNLTAHYADKVLMLSKGKIAAMGNPSDIFTSDTLEAVYGLKVKVLKKPFRIFHF